MDGNRGAKGSIKDRLISLLYRLRYQKKVLSEEEYTKEKKKIQKEYLELLQKFNELEDVSILEEKDQNKLDEIKFTGTVNLSSDTNIMPNNSNIKRDDVEEIMLEDISEKGNIRKSIDIKNDTKDMNDFTSISKRNIGIPNEIKVNANKVSLAPNDLEFNLTDIELSTNELNEKVNIKKEIKKTKDEITIIDEVEKFIKESLDNIDAIKKEIEEIKLEPINQDMTKLEKRYIELRKKIDKLKKQYDIVKNKYDLSDFKILESIKLIDTIEDYKNISRLNEMEMMVKVCKKEIEKIDSITVVNKEQKKVGSQIKTVKEDQNKVKIKFNRSKEKKDELDRLKDKITEELNMQQKIVDEMYSKASKIEQEITKTTEYIYKGNFLSSLLRIAGGVFTVPFTGKSIFGHALGATLINKGLKDLNKSYEEREKINVKYTYEDLSNKLSNVKDITTYNSILIDDSLREIEKLKNNFSNEYKKYSNILPDYNVAINDILKLELSLKEEQEKLNSINKKVEVEKELNDKKIKKIGELRGNK